nr:YhgE/Pip family protein [Microterricola viridarii]
MSARLEKLFRRTPGQRRTAFALMLAGIIVVPLAIAGLVSGALASADQRMDAVPAIVVNNDKMVTATLPDGSEQMILAGRQLVTELTAPDTAGFAWTISNSEQAAEALAAGKAYAVLTIPSDFSASINSLSGAEPTQADLQIKTDDAHAYLAGSAAQSVGEAMTSTFGRAITTQYLSAFYAGIAEMGTSLGTAADGAVTLSSGVGTLASGLDALSSGASSAASGAAGLADGASGLAGGVREYSTGVDGIAAGLGTLNEGAAGLTQLSDGVKQYTGGINQAAGQLSPYLDQGIAALNSLMPSLTPSSSRLRGARSKRWAASRAGSTSSWDRVMSSPARPPSPSAACRAASRSSPAAQHSSPPARTVCAPAPTASPGERPSSPVACSSSPMAPALRHPEPTSCRAARANWRPASATAPSRRVPWPAATRRPRPRSSPSPSGSAWNATTRSPPSARSSAWSSFRSASGSARSPSSC